MLATYSRLMYNVLWDPGYLPLGAERVQADSASQDSKRTHGKRRRHRRKSSSRKAGDTEKRDHVDVDLERGVNDHAGGKAFQLDPAGLESFYTKDVFVCQDDGRPPYCSTCCQFKTDRAHHCREVDRCVRKMDHFCPWYVGSKIVQRRNWASLTRFRVGGVVSETSFKFFIQFVVYTAVFCIFVLVVSAYYTAELRRNVSAPNAIRSRSLTDPDRLEASTPIGVFALDCEYCPSVYD